MNAHVLRVVLLLLLAVTAPCLSIQRRQQHRAAVLVADPDTYNAEDTANADTSNLPPQMDPPDEQADNSTDPSMMRTATGDPVVAANANEIRTIQEDTGSEVDSTDSAQAEKELKQSVELQRRKRKEEIKKNAAEQSLKSAETQSKSDHRARQKDKFEANIKRSKEEGRKEINEQVVKNEKSYSAGLKRSRSKQDTEMKVFRQQTDVSKTKLAADRRAWEVKVAVENEQLAEQHKKDTEQRFKQDNEAIRKKKAGEVHDKSTGEMQSKTEAGNKRAQDDRAAREERNIKRSKRQEADVKEEQAEEAAKRRKERDDNAREAKGKADRRVAEVHQKAVERGNKQQELRVKNNQAMKAYNEKLKKKLAEEDKKIQARKKEREQKQDNAAKQTNQRTVEQRNKRADAMYCQCSWVAENWEGYNRWFNCPSNSLVVGIFRQANQDLSAIQHYRCCRACRPDGSVLPLEGCHTENWMYSFDRAGWSYCAHNSYIQGFYKSSCNWIYCLEYAQCCRLRGSSGWRGCTSKGSWGSSFDRAGWNYLDGNYFMSGLYRSWGQYLYNIEFPYECIAKAY